MVMAWKDNKKRKENMKRIFLTSGLVVCMACPAFADLTAQQTVDPSGDAATCQYPTLEGYNGTSTFTAKWTPTYQTITLDKNVGTTAATGGLSTEDLLPTPLYSVPTDSHVWTGLDTTTGNLTGGTGDAGYAAGDAGLLSDLPQYGATATYVLNANLPANATVDAATALNGATASAPNRPFLGVYDQNGTTQYITNAGVLTSDGAAVAAANTNGTTWYAQYGTVTPTITGTPEIDGYEFQGWNTAADGTGATPGAIAQDTTVYAIWNELGYTITYDCGGPAGASTTASDPATASQSVTMDGSYTLAGADNCTLDGYTFAGWSCPNLPGDNTPNFAAGASGTYSYAGNVTCTAQWTANQINLVWDNNNATSGGTGGGDTCTFDGSITLPTVPTRTGYEFGGWEVVNTPAGSQQQSGN